MNGWPILYIKVAQKSYMSSSLGGAVSTVSFPIIPIALLKNDRISLISMEHKFGVYDQTMFNIIPMP